ncbi:LacI family DNA-binding transcriptional regulator [Amycolatopsis suaedae]|uniref:LacI family DNA-binding transcriptional regulator n=1 Tax=Amycolatopsis suaedae TaxID=2510978 RepID=UPI001F0F2334|nr:LacI family DNA-binding transcriptional regulator [Amycolatopsis suaedae]
MVTDIPGGEAKGRKAGSRVTLHDVAREAGVSYATASRAVHPGTRKVKEAARNRVLAAAAKLNYTPNLPAQAVARGSTMTVALVVGDVVDPYFSSLAAGARRAADDAGLTLTMAVTGGDPARELEIVRHLRGQRPQAIVVTGSRLTAGLHQDELIDELRTFERTGGRVVLISQPELPFPTIALQNRDGSRRLAAAIKRLGYRRPAVLRGPLQQRTSQERLDGVADEYELAPAHVIEAAFTRDGGYAAMRTLIERGLGDIDVIVALNDVMAIGAMSALRDAGIVPGRQIGVAGFDDLPTASDVIPTLTTVAAPLTVMGARAVQLALTDAATSGPEKVTTEVVIRDSTPPRPA